MPAPSNDNIANAIVLSGTSGSESGTTVDATSEGSGSPGDEEWYYGIDEPTVWYKYTSGATPVDLEIDLSGSWALQSDTISTESLPYDWNFGTMGFYGGDGTNDPPAYTIPVPANTTVYINVHSWNWDGSTGTFTLDWSVTTPTLTNDDFRGAERITSSQGIISDDMRDYTAVTDENYVDSVSDGTSWYYFYNEDSYDRRLILKETSEDNSANCSFDAFSNVTYSVFTEIYPGYDASGVINTATNGLDFSWDPDVTTILVPQGKKVWVRLIGPNSGATAQTSGFMYSWGRNYRVQAENDANLNADITNTSGIIKTTQDPVYDSFENPGGDMVTLWVRGDDLPPNGEYQLVCRLKSDSGASWSLSIKRNEVFVSHLFIDLELDSTLRDIPVTFVDGKGQEVTIASQSMYLRTPTKLYVNGQDLTFYFVPGQNTGNIYIDYLDFVYISSTVPSLITTPQVLDQGWLGDEVDGCIPFTGDAAAAERADVTPDMCMLDDGTIYAVSVESTTDASLLDLANYGPILWRLNGTTWEYVAGPLSDHAYSYYTVATSSQAKINPVHLATDGIDVWIAWSEAEEPGTPTTGEHKIRVMKYDVSSDTTSWVGSSSGLTPATGRFGKWMEFTFVVSRNDAASDASMPYLAFFTQVTGSRERPFVYKWNGSSWVDTSLPNTSVSAWSTGEWLIATIEPGVCNIGLTFCHADGLSDHPSVFMNPFRDDPVGSEESIFYYSEYNGTSWSTPFEWHAIDFDNAGLDYPTNVVGTTTWDSVANAQGLWLDNDGTRPIITMQMFSGGSVDWKNSPIIVARLNATGDAWEVFSGDPAHVHWWDTWGPMYYKTRSGKDIVGFFSDWGFFGYLLVQYAAGKSEDDWQWAPDNGWPANGDSYQPYMRGYGDYIYVCGSLNPDSRPCIRVYKALGGPINLSGVRFRTFQDQGF